MAGRGYEAERVKPWGQIVVPFLWWNTQGKNGELGTALPSWHAERMMEKE
jgi:hypothetical protein